MHVPAVVGHLVRGLVHAHGGVAAVAAVSQLVPQAARGHERHLPILVHGNSSVRVHFMKSAQLFVCVHHDIRITKSFFHRI